jgi:hypothetical protein
MTKVIARLLIVTGFVCWGSAFASSTQKPRPVLAR